jgi:ProP effector
MADIETAPDTPVVPETAAAPASSESLPSGDVLKLLNERFAVFREAKPLAIGIHKEVMKALPGLEASKMRNAMRRHTGTTRYLKAVATGTERYDLNGAVAGTISDEQKQQAGDTLRERFKKGADLRRAEKQAQQEKERAEAREKEKQVKLQALAQKFNKR